ncbi:YecA family protein [Gammaproteobacteria bacterium]
MSIQPADTLAASFDELNEILGRAEGSVSPAELQGHYCGLLCGGLPNAESLWLDEVALLWETLERTTLIQMAHLTRQSLEDGEAGFMLWLPGDEDPIRRRVAALGSWCQGFLYGWGLAGSRVGSGSRVVQQATSQEIISDLVEISQVDAERLRASEEAEESYAELVEYLRVAIMLLYQEQSKQNLGANLHDPVGG